MVSRWFLVIVPLVILEVAAFIFAITISVVEISKSKYTFAQVVQDASARTWALIRGGK